MVWGASDVVSVKAQGVLAHPQFLTFFRVLMHTVSTKERVLRSRMRLWKSGWGRPRDFSVFTVGALTSS